MVGVRVCSKAIYALIVSNSTSTEFYRVNHVIDGLTLHDDGGGSQLYWTDKKHGLIAALNVTSSPLRHRVIVSGLDKPRAIVVHNECVNHVGYSTTPATNVPSICLLNFIGSEWLKSYFRNIFECSTLLSFSFTVICVDSVFHCLSPSGVLNK